MGIAVGIRIREYKGKCSNRSNTSKNNTMTIHGSGLRNKRQLSYCIFIFS